MGACRLGSHYSQGSKMSTLPYRMRVSEAPTLRTSVADFKLNAGALRKFDQSAPRIAITDLIFETGNRLIKSDRLVCTSGTSLALRDDIVRRYQSILCALDLSENCGQLIEVAVSFEPEVVRLLHVCEHPITGFGESTGHNLRVTEAQIRQQVFPKINGLASEYGIDQREIEILFGCPSEIIHETAKSPKSDLIIIGSRCRPGLKRLLGSITSDVIHGAPCDILTVRI